MGLDNPLHIAFLLVIMLLVFGAKRLPEMGRSLGEGLRGFKNAIDGDSSGPAIAAVAPSPTFAPVHPDPAIAAVHPRLPIDAAHSDPAAPTHSNPAAPAHPDPAAPYTGTPGSQDLEVAHLATDAAPPLARPWP